MSSVFSDSAYQPSLCIDGITRNVGDDLNICLSHINETNPWLSLQLSARALIWDVTIHGRSDCCNIKYLLPDFEVWIDDVVGMPSVEKGSYLCGRQTELAVDRGSVETISCGGQRGTVVTLLLPGSSRTLMVSEMVVRGYPSSSMWPPVLPVWSSSPVSISHSPPPPQLSPSLAAQSPASSLLMSSLGASPLLSAPVSPPLAPFRPSTSPPASALFLHPMKLLLALTVLLICCCSFVRLRRKRTRQYELSSCSSNDVSEVIPPSWDVRRGCHAMPYVWGDDSLRGEGMVKQAAGLELPHGSAPSQIVGRCEYEEFEI